MGQLTITNRRFFKVVDVLNRLDYKSKNIIVRRAEKLSKRINEEFLPEYNNGLSDIDDDFCEKDKNGHSVREELVITDKSGTSQRGNTGSLKFSSENKIKRREAINKFYDREVTIPTYVIPHNETNESVYKKAFEIYSYTTLSVLSGIILEIPLDEEGFITDEFADKYSLKEEDSSHKNGVGKKELTN